MRNRGFKSAAGGININSEYSYFTNFFSVAQVETTDTGSSFTIKTYKNTLDKATNAVTQTELIGSYTIIKTID